MAFAHLSIYTRLNRTLFCFYSPFDNRCARHWFILMASFPCSLCLNRRGFRSFVELFRHVGIFHCHEPSFQTTCNLNPSCGISYKSYAAYKAHVYRHHFDSLQKVSTGPNGSSSSEDDEIVEPPIDKIDGHAGDESADQDDEATDQDNEPVDEDDEFFTGFTFSRDKETAESTITLADIQRTYIRFLIQLREEFLLPKKTISTISSNLVFLLESLNNFLQQQSVPLPPRTTVMTDNESIKRIIESNVVTTAIHDISRTIEATTRSEYEFVRLCKRFLNYQAPNEILLSEPGDRPEYGYVIPVSQTLSSLFHHPQILPLVLQNLECHHVSVANDDDLMLSLREGNFGMRIDVESILVQLYIDDIGLTNPTGSRKDRHKMTMIYFLVEDMPDKFRSQVQSINLLAICPHDSLKVREIFLLCLRHSVYLD